MSGNFFPISETEDEKLLPWDVRLFHKSWKVRNDANVDLAALCNSITDPEDPRLREFGLFFKNTVADSNPSVQERALDALIAYLKVADADSAERYAKEVCDVIAAKCLTGRPKTVEKLQMVFMLLIELESVDVVLVGDFGQYSESLHPVAVHLMLHVRKDAMEKAVMKKVAKAVVPAIDIILQALSEFGVKIVPPKRILKLLPELFDHRDQNVRASSKGLTLELCRWIGKETVKSVLFGKMPKTMKKELEAELVSVSGIARSSRKIRSEKNKEPEEEGVGFGPSEESVTDAPQEIECVESVDPVVVLTLEKAGLGDGVKAAKWSEQKIFVAKRIKLNSQLCIAPDYSAEIRQSLKKDRCKAVLLEFALAGCRPRVLSALVEFLVTKAKNQNVLRWCLNDETPEVRDAAFASLEAMAKWVGVGPSEELLEKLDDVRRKNFPEMNDYSGGPVCTSSGRRYHNKLRLVFEFCLKHMNMVEYCLNEDVLFISDGIGTL
ncbi:hypothetical protein RHGRI_020543 [Rhododendron griersonianum]|uniref:TOG domain-containing protein n=1 Tax=Rhododendron griersonianum TaxID=479676 RepID=A0AAV6JJM4_9ERIC|nr:hypothetical protein RHGRI_020543 [Rhododendron griersonianum]